LSGRARKKESGEKKASGMIRLASILTGKISNTETHRKRDNIVSGLWRR